MNQLTLVIESPASDWFKRELTDFNAFGKNTIVTSTEAETECEWVRIETYVNEFWTAKQRDANALHEISYRACFKPQLPRFFIERLTAPGDVVYDPFAGRGTTLIESALLGRVPPGMRRQSTECHPHTPPPEPTLY